MAAKLRPGIRPADFDARSNGHLPGWFGMQVAEIAAGRLVLTMEIKPEMLAPNGYLHAAAVVALADTSAGYATIAHLPEGAESFTTIELKTNFFATQKTGTLTCIASEIHAGRNTQVWDAEVSGESGRRLALFRCTQMVLWPKS
ncbi:MAG TPA: PaaI family thioesterase [Rhodocyclaceae bacterium]|nr:PaaI family thioesterase [Rhodocyclaceae bacterium]